MDRRRAAGALLALAACIACSTAAPTASNQTALEVLDGPSEGCYYNFQHYGEGDRIMTNEPCLNCTCHNRMLMCYLKVCPFTKPIGQDCTIEKRADQCCPIVTCPDVPVDLLTSTSTSSPAEYGATGLGKVDKYGCSINGKYFSEGSKVPPTPNKPCEHCYCIRNMTTCVMQECTLHVDGCTPIYHKDVCCPVRYSCDHLEDEMLLLDDMTTTVRPTPGFLLTTTTMPSVTQASQNCVHDDQIFADGALIKTEIACEHCYCMKGDIVCVVQECGTPMENEGKNCTSLPPRQGQCCPDTYICEGDELLLEQTTGTAYEELTTLSPPRRVEGSGYRNEPDEPYTEMPTFEGSGEEQATTLDSSDMFTSQKQTPEIIDEIFTATEESLKPSLSTTEADKEQNTVPDESISDTQSLGKTTLAQEAPTTPQSPAIETMKETDAFDSKTTVPDYHVSSETDSFISTEDEFIMTTEPASHYTSDENIKMPDVKPEIETQTTDSVNILETVTPKQSTEYSEPSSPDVTSIYEQEDKMTTPETSKLDEISQPTETTPTISKDDSIDNLPDKDKQDIPSPYDNDDTEPLVTTTTSKIEFETTSVNPVENEIDEDIHAPGRIPGEGDCLLDGVTYKNNTKVPNINNCHSSCKCVSSIVKCDPIICSPPPEQMDNLSDCQPIYDTPDACCPTYVCHSRETIPPESHSQMSGTESPKPSPESECHGEQCQPPKTNKPISPELCKSGNCLTETEDQQKECKNGACENAPLVPHPETCIGDTCQPSVETCTDGNCNQPTAGETICDNENGCQPSEACEGNDCVVGVEVKVPTKEHPICKDPENCKVTDTSCVGSECYVPNVDTQPIQETTDLSECTGKNCRRNEQPEENKPPSECSGSGCNIQEVEGEVGLTTESAITEQIYKEDTTEIIDDNYSKSPELQETPSGETEKVKLESTPEYQETSPERSTDKSQDSQLGHETVTEKVESYTDAPTKLEEPITEIYNKPVSDDMQEMYTTESIGEATESPVGTQYKDHATDSPKEDISNIPTKSIEVSTETLDIEPPDQEKNKYDVTDTMQQTSIKSTDIPETTPKLVETEETEQDYTKKQEMVTESPEEYSTRVEEALPNVTEKETPTKIPSDDNENTESQPDLSITEALPEITTEKHIDVKTKEDDVTPTVAQDEATNIPQQFTTEQSVQSQQSSEPHSETKVDETVTDKIYDVTEKDQITTEKSVVITELIPTEVTKTEEGPESPQTTNIESLPQDDTREKTTESADKDQQEITEMYDAVTDTTPEYEEEYVTSVSSVIHGTQPSSTEENLVTQRNEIPTVQKDDSTLPESTIKESSTSTIPQDIYEKEITTQQPEIVVQEMTTKTTDLHDVSSETMPDKLEEHTDASIKDFTEGATVTPEKTLHEDTTHKDSSVTEQQENDASTSIAQINEVEITAKPIPSSELDTTISPISFDKDQETTTKYTELEYHTEVSEESSKKPEVQFTVSDESTSSLAETEIKTLETSTISQVDGESITTESLDQPNVNKNEIPDDTQTDDQSQVIIKEPVINESTLAPTMSYTEVQTDSGDKTISVSIDDSNIEEKPLYTTPETIKEYTEKQDTTEKDITDTDSHDIYKPTEYTVSNEIEPQHTETTTQSQEAETKLVTELQTDQETSTTPVVVVKEDKGHTESPMSLVTKESEPTHSEEPGDSTSEKTGQSSPMNVPGDEEIKSPEQHEIQTQTPYTESSQLPEKDNKLDAEIPSKAYPEKESEPESTFASSPPESTTVKVLDIHDEVKTPSVTENAPLDMSTETEKLAPTTEYVTIPVQSSVSSDTESYQTVLHESTSVPTLSMSSVEPLATEGQEIPTRYPEISGSVTTDVYDHEPDAKPEGMPTEGHTLEVITEQPQKIDFTVPDSTKISDGKEEEHPDTQQQQQDIPVNVQDIEPTISPEEFVTKYPEGLDDNKDKETNVDILSKPEENTLASEQDITTESVIYVEQPVSPDTKTESSVPQSQEKLTEIIPSSDEIDVTPQSIAGVPELHYTTTESSEMLSIDENNRRTLSPIPVTIQSEQDDTEEQKVTESPEITKTQENEQTDTTQAISSNAPEAESGTSESSDEEFHHVTSIPDATAGNILLQTEVINTGQDEQSPTVTESVDKDISEGQDITLEPVTEIDVNEKVQTELPITFVTKQDEIPDKTEAQDDMVKVDSITPDTSSESTVAQELQTESSIPKGTETSEQLETEAPTPLETESEISVPIQTEIPVSKVTEPSILIDSETMLPKITEATTLKETDITASNIPESPISEVTKDTVPEESEASVPEVTGPSADKETTSSESSKPKATEVTESSAPGATESSIPEVIKVAISEVTESSTPEITEASVSEVAEVSAPEITEASITEITESPVSGITQGALSEATEASAAEQTGVDESEVTKVSVPEVTEAAIPVSDTSIPKETENVILNKEPEGTTYEPQDEKSEEPMEQSPTLQPTDSSSETTPYLVELQEHTTKVNEDISSVSQTEEDRTRAPETYVTERGDQPLDNVPDKFTQEESSEEPITKETFTKKDEQVTILPPEHASEYPEKVPDKTEITTEEILISESPIPTHSDVQIGQHTPSSEEQSVTVSPTDYITSKEQDKFTTVVFETETSTDKKDLPLDTEKTPEHEIMHETTGSEDLLNPPLTKATTISTPEEVATRLPIVDDKLTKPEETPSGSYSPTAAPELPKPGINEIQPTEEIPTPDFPSGSSGYGQEPDYVEEDQAFGPGTCRYGGKVYVSAQQIPRDDPCDFCFCFRSDIICLQQSCPPPIHGCHEEPIQGFCCPRYECPVSMATTLNVTTTTTTTTTTLPPHFLPHAYKGAAQRRGCQIKGHSYKVGEVVRASSGPCLHCTCGGDGQMKCDPKACTPEPMLRQMIAAAVSAKRRR